MFPRERMRFERRNPDHFFFGHPKVPPMPMRSPFPRQGGGLLQKLLGRKQQPPPHPFQLFPPPPNETRGILQTLSNPEKINQFLANSQKVLDTAQQIKPMVEQYGPMIKNLPMLWKLYKGFRDIPSDTDEAKGDKSALKNEGELEKMDEDEMDEMEEEKELKQTTSKKGASVPKLYI